MDKGAKLSELKKQLLQTLLRSHVPGESGLAERIGETLVRNELIEVGGEDAVREVYQQFEKERVRLLSERETALRNSGETGEKLGDRRDVPQFLHAAGPKEKW